MEKIFIKSFYLSLLSLILFSCKKDDMNYKDVSVTPVKKLYAPVDNRSVKLLSSASASLYFEWEAVRAEDGGAAAYEVVFDKADGDFSDPLYKIVSDNNGYSNGATITHKILNRIAGLAGIEPGGTGAIKWSVIASRGINTIKSDESFSIMVTALQGFADLPDEVFITGEGSETGNDLSAALPFKFNATGEFEIYTKLEAGKPYYFTDRNNGTPRIFYSDNGSTLKEASATGSITASKTGVYRINLDFNTATIAYTEVTSIGIFFSPENRVLFNLDYQGKGIWKGTGVINFRQESWGRDQRYKFQMVTVANGTTNTGQLGTVNGTDSPPTASSPASYYYLRVLPNPSQWDDKWKFISAVDGKSTTITVLMQGSSPYTHTVQVN
ncbi:SusE domain-containing protein [Niabella insulamsoli]|uniref:SusE domain-containing protein n=1 Tax=Niabella insulamsoli TaxID=3144874 RepID=UPI0031FCE3A1